MGLIPQKGLNLLSKRSRVTQGALERGQSVMFLAACSYMLRPIIQILRKRVVGRVFIERGVAFVIAENKRINQDILIAPESLANVKEGQVVVAEIIEQQMARAIDVYLDQLEADAAADRRNGYYRRHLLTELGDIELSVPRTRRYIPVEVLRAYARRTRELDRVILSAFVLGVSTRKVGETLLSILGRPVSPTTVSQVAKTLDSAVAAFHRRPLQNCYKVLMLDGVVLARKTGAGALRRPVLVALGLRADGKKEVIDFRLAASESAAEWEKFLADLYRRGLTGEGLDMICVDGGSGLLAALPNILHGIPVQRCWAHKIRNVLSKVRVADRPAVKADLHAVMNARTLPQARSAARRFADRWAADYL